MKRSAALAADALASQDPSSALAVNCRVFDKEGLGIGVVTREFDTALAKLYVIGAGDLHGDSDGVKRLREVFGWARDNCARVLLTGDMYDFRTRHSVSFEHGASAPAFEIDRVNDLIQEHADMIDGVVRGNHDVRPWRDAGEDPLRRVCRDCSIPYHPDALVILYKFGHASAESKSTRLCYTVFLTHTCRGGRSAGSKLNKLVDLQEVIVADVYLAGHSHDLTTHKSNLIHVDRHNNGLIQRTRAFANCGGQFPYVGYPVAMNFPPSKRGVVRVRLDGRHHDVHLSI